MTSPLDGERRPARRLTAGQSTAKRTVRTVPRPADAAAQARQLAAAAPGGSLDRKAYGCAAVALATTRTLVAALAALDDVTDDAVRAEAVRVVRELTS